jgi:hypothetical protein
MRKNQHIKNCFFQVEELEKIKLENAWNSLTIDQNVKRSFVKIDCHTGNEKRFATPHPKLYLKYLCFPTKDAPPPK